MVKRWFLVDNFGGLQYIKRANTKKEAEKKSRLGSLLSKKFYRVAKIDVERVTYAGSGLTGVGRLKRNSVKVKKHPRNKKRVSFTTADGKRVSFAARR